MKAKEKQVKLQYKGLDEAVKDYDGKAEESARAALFKTIEAAFKAETSARHKIQTALVAIALHAWKCGDWESGLNYLMDKEDGIKLGRRGAVAWACKFIGLTLVPSIGKDGKPTKAKKFGGFKGKEYIKANFQEAKATMYWDLEPKDEFTGYDANDKMRAAIASIRTVQGKLERDEYTAEEKLKVVTKLNEGTIKMLLDIINFEVIDGGKIAPKADVADQTAPIAVQQKNAA